MNTCWRRRLLHLGLAPFILLVAGCATGDRLPSLEEMQINELLDDIRVAAEPEEIKSCLFARSYDDVEIVNERRLIFYRRGGGAWLNELRNECTGLRRTDALVFDLRGSSVCNLDRVSGLSPGDRMPRAGAVCTLGKFIEIPEYQVERVNALLNAL